MKYMRPALTTIVTAGLMALTAITFANNENLPNGRSLGAPVIGKIEVKAWGKIAEGQQLAISTDKDVYDVGEPILLTITRQNTSDAPMTIKLNWLPLAYRFIVQDDVVIKDADDKPIADEDLEDESGEVDREARYIQHTRVREASQIRAAAESIKLNPGEMFTQTFRLNAIWDLTRPATYSATIQGSAPGKTWAEKIEAFTKANPKKETPDALFYNLISNSISFTVKDLGYQAWIGRLHK